MFCISEISAPRRIFMKVSIVIYRLHWHIFIAHFLLRRKFASINGYFLTRSRRGDLCAVQMTCQLSHSENACNARRRKSAVHLHTQIKCVGSTQKMCGKTKPAWIIHVLQCLNPFCLSIPVKSIICSFSLFIVHFNPVCYSSSILSFILLHSFFWLHFIDNISHFDFLSHCLAFLKFSPILDSEFLKWDNYDAVIHLGQKIHKVFEFCLNFSDVFEVFFRISQMK